MIATLTHVPPTTPYLTAGKPYPVIRWLGDAFTFDNDHGGRELALVRGCNHLDGGDWDLEGGNVADG